MNIAGMLCLAMLLEIASHDLCETTSPLSSREEKHESEESERLAGFLFDQFRRHLELDGKQASKPKRSDGLLVLKGLNFGSKLRGISRI